MFLECCSGTSTLYVPKSVYFCVLLYISSATTCRLNCCFVDSCTFLGVSLSLTQNRGELLMFTGFRVFTVNNSRISQERYT